MALLFMVHLFPRSRLASMALATPVPSSMGSRSRTNIYVLTLSLHSKVPDARRAGRRPQLKGPRQQVPLVLFRKCCTLAARGGLCSGT